MLHPLKHRARQRAERGAALLDRTYGAGTWEPHVDPERIDLRSTKFCVLAQASGRHSFARGVGDVYDRTHVYLCLTHRVQVRYGFDKALVGRVLGSHAQEQAWADLITARLSFTALMRQRLVLVA